MSEQDHRTQPVDQPVDQPGAQPVDQPADGRSRLLAALKRPGSRGQVVAAGLLAVLGFAAVTQVQSNDDDDQYVGAREGDLVQLINNLSLASQRAETEIAQLAGTRDALRDDTQSRRTALRLAEQQAGSLGILAGTVPAVGQGVRITVSDPGTAVGTNQILDGIEELRDAGAEVIEFNDRVRVVAQTAITDTGDGAVQVDGRRIEAPYVIDAIGEPGVLADSLTFALGPKKQIEDDGGTMEVSELKAVDIEAVANRAEPRYALPEQGQ
jgi:uncharacterized protein YlxW (UPF0749 family)